MDVGAHLRRVRQSRGLSREDVAHALRIPIRYVQAMEEGDWHALPGGYYRRAFVRMYANWLGIPLEADTLRSIPLGDVPTPPRRSRLPSFSLWIAGIITAVVAGMIGVSWVWWMVFHRSEPFPPVFPEEVRRVATSNPSMPSMRTQRDEPSSQVPLSLRLVARENCWLEIHADGHRVFLGILQAGEALRIQAHAQIRLVRVSNAGALQVYVNGHPLKPLGAPGEIRKDIVFNAQTIAIPMPGISPRGR